MQDKFWMLGIKWEQWFSEPLFSFLHLLCVLRCLDWISRLLCSLASGWVWPVGGVSRRLASRWRKRELFIPWVPSLPGHFLLLQADSSWHAAISLRLLSLNPGSYAVLQTIHTDNSPPQSYQLTTPSLVVSLDPAHTFANGLFIKLPSACI